MSSYTNKILPKEKLKKEIEQLKKQGKVVVQCHGCFDIIHPGHIRYLEQAKKFGDILIVSLTPDKYILKGDDRPFMPQELRLKNMAALQIVDYVILDEDSWAGPILSYLQPDIYVKGKEYENVFSGVFGDERKAVEAYGGKVYFTSGDVVFSSSSIIQNYKEKFALDYEVYSIFCERNKITYQSVQQLIEKFDETKIAVIGEVLVDEYVYSDVIGVSGEAPILTVRPLKQNNYTGAAGIVAKHIRSLGGEVTLFSYTGKDKVAQFIKSDLEKNGLNYFFIENEKFNTICKTRFISDHQKLLKIDYSENIILSDDEEKAIIEAVQEKCAGYDVIVFSDFAYGLITEKIRVAVTQWANSKGIKVIADVSSTLGGNIARYEDVYLITPTEKEARMVFDDKTSGLSTIAYRLLEKTHAQNIIITLGANGLLAFKNKPFTVYGRKEKHLEQEYIPALEKNAKDPVGAGDAMLATISMVIAANGTLSEAVYLGNMASAIEVMKEGNIPVTRAELLEKINTRPELSK